MKRLAAILALTLLIAAPAVARDWQGVARHVERSVVMLANTNGGTCTAFSINQPKGYFLTAAHCIAGGEFDAPLSFGIYSVRVIFYDEALDLAVVQTDKVHLPALYPAHTPNDGAEIAILGYALGMPRPLIKAGIVASTALAIDGINITFYDFPAIPGMSGGPIVDRHGEVTGVVQQTIGAGRIGGIAQQSVALAGILEATSQFWEARISLPVEKPEDMAFQWTIP